MFEILSKEVEMLYQRLENITKYIAKNEKEKYLIKKNSEKEFENKDIKEYIEYIAEEDKSPINYNAVIISLYGCYENFIDNILINYLEIITSLGIKYENLDKAIIDNHERLVGDFLSNTNRYKNYDLNTKEIISKLNSCLNKEENFKLNNRILISHSGNLNIESINNVFRQVGIRDIWHRIKWTSNFITYYKEKENIVEDEVIKEIFKSNKNDNILFGIIGDLVERRNAVAHSWNEDDRIGNQEIKEKYIPFLKTISKSIYRIILEEIYGYLYNNNKLVKIEKIYKLYDNQILCINSGENNIEKNDFIYIINNSKKYLAQIVNMQIDHNNVDKCNEQEDVGLQLDIKITNVDEIYIFKNSEV